MDSKYEVFRQAEARFERTEPYRPSIWCNLCPDLKGFGLAWHRYAAHGGPYPRKPRRQRAKA